MSNSTPELCLCPGCALTTPLQPHCPRCRSRLYRRRPFSLQYSWALLITAACLLLPANLLPITQLINQGNVSYDTIYSGILSLIANDMTLIAIIVFTASVAVPAAKVVGLLVILSTISLRWPLSKKRLSFYFHIIEFIGRWSMLDLFVISIMASLINMGQLLDARPAPAATYFALVILFTQLSAKCLDTRLLWDLEKDNNDL
ncbi:paraquat-inducible protein A [Ferrimonas gelatinilytica]|uniref:Paraquat-inducible protein A n=1 Tax=Ferrimonas gelatinilytica TaxID=1255257 RepID=A0ABP9RV91_9GAMM